MQRHDVKSSNVKAIGFDASTKTLEIEFHNGRVQHYFGISEELYGKLMTADSVGSFLHAKIIKGGFESRRVGDKQEGKKE